MALFQHVKKNNSGNVSAVIPAAGLASRMRGTDKLFWELDGVPVILHTLRVFNAHPDIGEIIIPTRAENIEKLETMCREYGIDKAKKVICGGKTRAESVLNGVRQASKRMSLVAIHDAARPFVTERIISDTVSAARQYSAAAPAVPLADTVKEQRESVVLKTLDRAALAAVQTPQIFDRELILSALSHAVKKNIPITDDCSAVEAVGMRVVLTKGDVCNRKITTPEDLIFARAIFEYRKE